LFCGYHRYISELLKIYIHLIIKNFHKKTTPKGGLSTSKKKLAKLALN